MGKKVKDKKSAGKLAARVFKSKSFKRFARSEGISDAKLIDAVRDIEGGLIDADLGGGLLKQRIAREGQGKSGGHRAVILYRKGKKAFFVHGFSKNGQGNLTDQEKETFKAMAKIVLGLSEEALKKAIEDSVFTEVMTDEQNDQKA